MMSKKFDTFEKFDFDQFETISDEELTQISGGGSGDIFTSLLYAFELRYSKDPVGTFNAIFWGSPSSNNGSYMYSSPYGAGSTPNDGY